MGLHAIPAFSILGRVRVAGEPIPLLNTWTDVRNEEDSAMPSKEIARFAVSHLQILDEEGNVDKGLEPDLSPEVLVRIYRLMYLAREGDQRMLKLQRQGRVGTFGPCTGQEACVVAPAVAMTEKDWFVGSFRELGVIWREASP
jgi:hypothetical protein